MPGPILDVVRWKKVSAAPNSATSVDYSSASNLATEVRMQYQALSSKDFVTPLSAFVCRFEQCLSLVGLHDHACVRLNDRNLQQLPKPSLLLSTTLHHPV